MAARKTLGMKPIEAKHMSLLIRWVMMKMVQADLQMIREGDLAAEDNKLIQLACKQLAHATAKQANALDAPTTVEHIFGIKRTVAAIEKTLKEHSKKNIKDVAHTAPPELKLYSNSAESKALQHFNFGRFRKDGFDVEHLAGNSEKPPIFLPGKPVLSFGSV
eukprot:Stramenopile-MAST_4_protein_6438